MIEKSATDMDAEIEYYSSILAALSLVYLIGLTTLGILQSVAGSAITTEVRKVLFSESISTGDAPNDIEDLLENSA